MLYSRKVDSEAKDTELENSIEESELGVDIEQSWTESLFYGLGNTSVN